MAPLPFIGILQYGHSTFITVFRMGVCLNRTWGKGLGYLPMRPQSAAGFSAPSLPREWPLGRISWNRSHRGPLHFMLCKNISALGFAVRPLNWGSHEP